MILKETESVRQAKESKHLYNIIVAYLLVIFIYGYRTNNRRNCISYNKNNIKDSQ